LIPLGIPSSRAEWPPGLLEHLRQFLQGHVVQNVPLGYWGDPKHPVFALTREYETEGVCSIEMPFGLITTQTCDIGEEDKPAPSLPWVQLAPIYDAKAGGPGGKRLLDGGQRNLIEAGRIQHLLHVPQIPDGFWVADLRILVPVEKGWLATRHPITGFADDRSRHEVGRRLAFLHRRPAFDPRFVRVVQGPLIDALRALAKTDRPFYEVVHAQVLELGVRTDSNLSMTFAEAAVFYDAEIDDRCREWFLAQWDAWAAHAKSEEFNLLELRFRDLREICVAEYRSFTTVPLAMISPSLESFGPDPFDAPTA
jgi:hypothetical protein